MPKKNADRTSNVDETLIAQQLRLTPEQRLAQLESMYEWGRELIEAGTRARGELAEPTAGSA